MLGDCSDQLLWDGGHGTNWTWCGVCMCRCSRVSHGRCRCNHTQYSSSPSLAGRLDPRIQQEAEANAMLKIYC